MNEITYPKVSIETASAELNRLHQQIERSLRRTVQDAIRAGKILTTVKDSLDHGEFLPWIEENCRFSDETARKYMGLFRHQNKIQSSWNLQDAYQKVAQIETAEKQSEEKKARVRVMEYLKTGKKPDGWRRGTDDKLAEAEKKRQDKIEESRKKLKEERERREKETDPFDEVEELLLEEIVEKEQQRQTFKERIRLSQAGEKDAFIDALMDYLDELDSDSRRIEACQNIIKVCRNIAVELQKGASNG